LEAAGLTSVAWSARLSLDLNNSPTPKQLGLHSNFPGASNYLQIGVIFFFTELFTELDRDGVLWP
jgi:hypothetical protein